MRILVKLIAAFAVAMTLLIGALFVMVQSSFDRQLLDYVNERELRNMQTLADNLGIYHELRQGFDALSLNKPVWDQLMRLSEQQLPLTESLLTSYEALEFQPKYRRDRRPPPPHKGDRLGPSFRDKGAGPLSRPPDHFKPAQRPVHLALMDVDKKVLIGRSNSNYQLRAIKVGEDIVGWLGIPATKEITDVADLAFAQKLNQSFVYICLLVLGIVFIVAIPLSRQLLTPIRRLALATAELKQGKFDIKLPTKGRDELANLARDFTDLAQRLQHNESSRNKWLANISHELRTPLAVIKGEVEAMLDGVRPLSKHNLQSLNEEILQLQKLIDDLYQLNSAEIGALKYQKQQVDVCELVQNNIERHRAHVESQRFALTLMTGCREAIVWADPTRLHQLIDNLMSNAMKYTDTPGQITVSVERQQERISIEIEDSAPGVPEEALTQIFDHLYRVESSRNRKTGGSGLGLAFCKKMIENHDGEISAYPSKLGGLGIRCSLPLI